MQVGATLDGLTTPDRRDTPSNGAQRDGHRGARIAAATLDLIRSGERSLRVLELGNPETSLALLCADDEVAALDGEDIAEAPDSETFDCAVSVDRIWRLEGEERTEHLEALRSQARIVLIEAPLNGDSVLEDAGRFFEEQGDWTALVSEDRLAELRALSALDGLDGPGEAIRSLATALENLSRGSDVADRGVLISATDESAPGFDLQPLRPDDSPGAVNTQGLLAGALPLALEMQRTSNRLAAAERRSQGLELALQRRDSQLTDLSTKLAELSRVAAEERRVRRRIERDLEEAKGTRGYRLGLWSYRVRTRMRRGARRFGAAILSPLRRAKRRLSSQAAR